MIGTRGKTVGRAERTFSHLTTNEKTLTSKQSVFFVFTTQQHSQHRHDVLRHPLAARQEHQEREEDQEQRRSLSRLVNLRHVVLGRKLGRPLADEHVQRPRQAQARRDEAQGQADVDAQRSQPEGPAPEPGLGDPSAVDLAHGEHIQRLGHETAPGFRRGRGREVSDAPGGVETIAAGLVPRLLEIFRVMEVTHMGSR